MRLLLMVGLFLLISRVEAFEIQRYGSVNAVGACQAPLPVYDQQLRKRPMAIANESSSAVFVSCSASNHANLGSEWVAISIWNRNDFSVSITCTLVQGAHQGSSGDHYYLPKTIEVPSFDSLSLEWSAFSDNNGSRFFRTNLSCRLPGNVELGEITNAWKEEIGD